MEWTRSGRGRSWSHPISRGQRGSQRTCAGVLAHACPWSLYTSLHRRYLRPGVPLFHFVTCSLALQGVPCSCGPSPHACTLETRSSPRTHRGTCVVMPPQPPSPPPSPCPGLHDRPHPKPLGAPPHVTRPLACLWECPCVMQRHGAWLPSTARAARGLDLCSCATGAPQSCPVLAWVTTTVTAKMAATNRATLHAPPGGSTATRVWRSFPRTTPVGRREGVLAHSLGCLHCMRRHQSPDSVCTPPCTTPSYRSRASAFIPSTLVGDGVCDCCGGEDEGGKCAEIPDCSALLA